VVSPRGHTSSVSFRVGEVVGVAAVRETVGDIEGVLVKFVETVGDTDPGGLVEIVEVDGEEDGISVLVELTVEGAAVSKDDGKELGVDVRGGIVALRGLNRKWDGEDVGIVETKTTSSGFTSFFGTSSFSFLFFCNFSLSSCFAWCLTTFIVSFETHW